MWIEEPGKIGYQSFKEIAEKLGEKKLKDLCWQDICKYLLVDQTIEQADEEFGDDAQIILSFDDEELEILASHVMWDLDTMIKEDFLENYPLYAMLSKEDLK